MIGLFTDRYKVILLMASIFILGIGISLYFIYSLPHTLQLSSGYDEAFSTVFIVLGSTFFVGTVTLLYALRYKKEVVVFRDRALEAAIAQQEGDQSGKTTISLEHITTLLDDRGNEKDLLLQGLQAIAKELQAGQAAVYKVVEEAGKRKVELDGGYALTIGESTEIKFEFGEGLVGQAAANGNTLYVDDVPEGYIKIVSGLGSAYPKYLLIVPIKNGDQVKGVLEIASFTKITEDQRRFVEEAAQLIAEKISTKA
ncbi:MAG TPA: GAF domain-containing protein [Chryseolinea sp.]|nr:GAF domain-containing protein [Chryseolinea sp.]